MMILTKIINNDISKKVSLEGCSFWSDGTPDHIPSFSDDFFKLIKNNNKVWSYVKRFPVPDYPLVFSLEIKISFEEDAYGTIKSFISFTPVSDFFSEDEIYAMCSKDSFEDESSDDFYDLPDFSSINYTGVMGSCMHYSSEFTDIENEKNINNKESISSKSDVTSNFNSLCKILNIKSDVFYRDGMDFIESIFFIREQVFKSFYFRTLN